MTTAMTRRRRGDFATTTTTTTRRRRRRSDEDDDAATTTTRRGRRRGDDTAGRRGDDTECCHRNVATEMMPPKCPPRRGEAGTTTASLLWAQCSSQRLQDVPLAILSLPGLLQGVFIRFGLRRADNPKLLTNLEPNPKTWQPRSPTPPTSPETWLGELPASLRRSRPGCGEKAGGGRPRSRPPSPPLPGALTVAAAPKYFAALAAVPGLHNRCSPRPRRSDPGSDSLPSVTGLRWRCWGPGGEGSGGDG